MLEFIILIFLILLLTFHGANKYLIDFRTLSKRDYNKKIRQAHFLFFLPSNWGYLWAYYNHLYRGAYYFLSQIN